MTDDSSTPVRHAVGLRMRRNGPVLWHDPGNLKPKVGEWLVIATEDGERTAHVAVGPTAVPPGTAISPLRVLAPGGGAAESPADIAGARVDAVAQAPRHATPPVGTRRVARFINRILAVRRQHPGARPPLVDLGQAFPSSDLEDSATG